MRSAGIVLKLGLFLSVAVATAAQALAAEPTELSGSVAEKHADRRLGEHPAVIVQRLHAQRGFDHEGTFYPHPAWLFLSSEAPRPMMDHPAVTVFRRYEQEQAPRLATPRPYQNESDNS